MKTCIHRLRPLAATGFATVLQTLLLPVLLLPVLLLTGCSGLLTSEQPPRQVYLLQPLSAADGGAAGTAALHFRLDVIPGLDTDRVLALEPDARLVPYANARWPDHLPEVLGSVLRRSLESTGRFGRIEAAALPADDEWSLTLELRAFYGLRDGAGGTRSVRVALAGQVACGGATRKLQLEASAAVAEERLSAVVAAHQAALDDVSHQLVRSIDDGCAAP